MRSRPVHVPLIVLTLLATGLPVAAALARQATQSAKTVQAVALPIEFPAVGNLEAVRSWHFARIEDVEGIAGQGDITLRLRNAKGEIVTVIGPRLPLRELAFESGWVRSELKTTLTRNDYAERMVAVDVDDNGRLIAMASLEPLARDRNKLRRALN